MRGDEGAPSLLSSSPAVSLRNAWSKLAGLRFGGPELGGRFALVVFALAAMAITRTVSFADTMASDSDLPSFGPMLWLFHRVDGMFLPFGNKLPNLNTVQQVQFVCLVISLALFILVVRRSLPSLVRRHYRPMVYAAIVLAVLLSLLNLQGLLPFTKVVGSSHYGNDAITVTDCAKNSMLNGHNAYSSFNVTGCLNSHGEDGTKTTPLKLGEFSRFNVYPTKQDLVRTFNRYLAAGVQHPPEFESEYSYPAVSFLFPALVAPLHLDDLSLLYLLVYAAMAVLIVRLTPRGTPRRLVLLAVCANAALGPTLVSGSTDAVYTLLVLVAWIAKDKRWLSAGAMGLAAASRQQAWFFLLFYAVLAWRTEGRKEAVRRMAIVAGIFLLTNLPFFLASPSEWMSGVLGPLRDPMFPRGSGIVSLSTGGAGALPLAPKLFYNVLEFASLAGLLAFYWRVCRANPWIGLVLAPLPLFFAWRSLYSYFLPITLLALYPAFAVFGRPGDAAKVVPERREDAPADAAA